MNRKQLIEEYLGFFESKNHKKISNSSLIPENDPTVLFITAGMHPLVPFLLGEDHPLGKRLVGVQRCIRTGDIEEVGDSFHHTFFEMLGNWSLADYFKEEAITNSFEFLTKILKLSKERLAISVFSGNQNFPEDKKSFEIWRKLGIPKERIALLEDNWWETLGGGPCGPDTEMFYWKSNQVPAPKVFNPEDENWIELWNDVFMEYKKDGEGKYSKSEKKNVDTGMGVERTLSILNGLEDNYEGEMWKPIIKVIEEISNKKYCENKKVMRIIADHFKAACFILNDRIIPTNSERGYVLRRLIRRAIRNLKKLGLNFGEDFQIGKILEKIYKIYGDYDFNKSLIITELKKEIVKFQKTLDKGLRQFQKFSNRGNLKGKEAFLLYQSYGFPLEMIVEECNDKNIKFNPNEFKLEFNKHRELSQTALRGRFKSGLNDKSEATTRLHTATHLLLAALKKVLGEEVIQKGSNINNERLRFDFAFPRKLTEEEKRRIENLVNQEINKKIGVVCEKMSLEDARKKGASGIFENKYSEIVSVYTIGNFSKEICKGPHVKNTQELGKFKILKEQSSSEGVRRIRATLDEN